MACQQHLQFLLLVEDGRQPSSPQDSYSQMSSHHRLCLLFLISAAVLQAWLAGGEWHRLLPADHPGLPEVKWCMNRFVPFLAVDPQPDLNPGSRDAEEASMEVGSD
jgi:hypothetical protein